MNFDFNRLYLFYRVAPFERLTQAAQVVHLTQSAISQQIKILEEELGFALFDRVKNRLVITSQGIQLYEELKSHFPLLKQSMLEIAHSEDPFQGTICIAGLTEFTVKKLSPVLRDFVRIHPKAKIKILYPRAKQALKALEQLKIDLLIMDESIESRKAISQDLFEEEIILVMSKNHPAARMGLKDYFMSQGWKGVGSIPLAMVMFEDNHIYLKKWFHFCIPSKKFTFQSRIISPHVPTMIQMVKEGIGWALLPAYLCEQEADLIKVPLEEILNNEERKVFGQNKMINQIQMLYLPLAKPRPLVQEFLSFVKQHFQGRP